MRIGSLITMYALVSFLCVCFPSAQVYIHPWLDVVEGTSLGSFFLLLCEFISPVYTQQEAFFTAKRKGGGKWFKVKAQSVLLSIIVNFEILDPLVDNLSISRRVPSSGYPDGHYGCPGDLL
jgi:hypothetical protein